MVFVLVTGVPESFRLVAIEHFVDFFREKQVWACIGGWVG